MCVCVNVCCSDSEKPGLSLLQFLKAPDFKHRHKLTHSGHVGSSTAAHTQEAEKTVSIAVSLTVSLAVSLTVSLTVSLAVSLPVSLPVFQLLA